MKLTRRGRPPKVSEDQLPDLVAKFKSYIAENDLPIISEFAYQNEIPRQMLYEKDEFATLIKIATQKKEANLERGALTGALNPTMAVFSLKQLGWSDKQQVETNNTNHNMNTDVNQLSPDERRARIDELNRRRGNGAHSAS